MFSIANKRLSQLINRGEADLVKGGKTGLERECLRMGPDGSIAQTPHPAALGSALTHPWITTDYSEALLEFITPPMTSAHGALIFLRDIEQFVYSKLEDELLWSASMPCVVAGESHIPIAQYGTSNAGMMKTVYRRGLGYRYGRVMQVIAGCHYNYSFAESFWPVFQALIGDTRPLADFITDSYFCLTRNLQRHGWLIPYLFGCSPAVCKSFMGGKRTTLKEFSDNTYYEPYATSLRMCDIGYQNNREEAVGFKACYDNLDEYVHSLIHAIDTPSPRYVAIGVKVGGEYRQLNANILQIENEYYSSVRPKQIPDFNEKPVLALLRRGVRYVELRSLDINVYEPLGISDEQCRFLEAFMLFNLFNESPIISKSERREIDENLNNVSYRGRDPELKLQRNGESILLAEWAGELCEGIRGFSELLDHGETGTPYTQALNTQAAAVRDPALTLSARVLDNMLERGEGYFHFTKRMSQQHQRYFRELPMKPKQHELIEELVARSFEEQQAMEDSDTLTFDEFLRDYFAQKL